MNGARGPEFLADWERDILGLYIVLAVFHKDGESTVIQHVDPDSIKVHRDGLLSFKVSGGRKFVFADWRYWTEN